MTHDTLALLDGLGGPELLVIGLVVLLLFGSKRMPEIGRGLGRAIREFKRATSSVEDNLREVLYDEPTQPRLRPPAQRRPYRETVATPPAPIAPTSSPANPAGQPELGLAAPAPADAGSTNQPTATSHENGAEANVVVRPDAPPERS